MRRSAPAMTLPLTEVQSSESGAWTLDLHVCCRVEGSADTGVVGRPETESARKGTVFRAAACSLWAAVLYSVKYMVTCGDEEGTWLPYRLPCDNRKPNHKT